jgi:hypothetical protein
MGPEPGAAQRGMAVEVSKTELAKVLWPALRARIDQCRRSNAPIPPVVEVVRDAYHIAQQ